MKFLQKTLLFLFIGITLRGAERMESLLFAPEEELQKYYYGLLPAELRWQLLQMTGSVVPLFWAVTKQMQNWESTRRLNINERQFHLPGFTLEEHRKYITHIAFSPDGTLFGTASLDGNIKIYNVSNGQLLKILRNYPTTSFAFNPDNIHLATADTKNQITIWDITTGQSLEVIQEDVFFHIAYNPQGNLLAVATPHGIKILDVFSQYTPVRILNERDARSITFNHRGSLIISGEGGSTKIWDLNTGQVIKTFNGGGIVTLNKVETILINSFEGKVCIWDINNPEKEIGCITKDIKSFALNSDGNIITSVQENGDLFLVDIFSGTGLKFPVNGIGKVAFHPHDNTILATSTTTYSNTGDQIYSARIWKPYNQADFDFILSSPERFNLFKTAHEKQHLDLSNPTLLNTFQALPKEWKQLILRTVPVSE